MGATKYCDYCKIPKSAKNFARHLQSHGKNASKPAPAGPQFQCHICHKWCVKSQRRRHYKRNHSGNQPPPVSRRARLAPVLIQDEDDHSVRIGCLTADKQPCHNVGDSNNHDEVDNFLEELQVLENESREDHASTLTTQIVTDSEDAVPIHQGNSTADVKENLVEP